MKNKILKCLLWISIIIYIEPANSEGFTANWVDIKHLNNGRFRVIIKYTNIQVGEYREAYVPILALVFIHYH